MLCEQEWLGRHLKLVVLMRDCEVVTPSMQMCGDLAWRICSGVGQKAE